MDLFLKVHSTGTANILTGTFIISAFKTLCLLGDNYEIATYAVPMRNNLAVYVHTKV